VKRARPGSPPLPRSYVMPKCDVEAAGWPLTADSATGVGVRWDTNTLRAALGEDAIAKARGSPDSLPGVKLSLLPDPAHTLLLTELPTANNRLGNVGFTVVAGAREQYRKDNAESSHHGSYNYLMVDGQVERLTKKEAGGEGPIRPPAGIWTIKQGD
jgi:prepilin-type processing-associated H-X9-DG protein